MVINGTALLADPPIREMLLNKHREHGVSHGLSEVGYDIRLKQDITFMPGSITVCNGIALQGMSTIQVREESKVELIDGTFALASSIEYFDMPKNLVGIVHDKSTWARHGLSVFNTVIEPGWFGHLTLELSFKGIQPIHIPAGAGIAQVIFHQLSNTAAYDGKYQGQADRPVMPIMEA